MLSCAFWSTIRMDSMCTLLLLELPVHLWDRLELNRRQDTLWLVVLCSGRDQPEHRVRAPGSAICWQTAQTPGSPVRERSVKATGALQGHALCRKLALSLSRSLPLCPLLCGKNRSTDLSVQLFFVLLTFTWISPGAAAVGSCLTFLCFCVFVYLRTSLIVACLYACRSTTVHHLTWHFNKSGILVLVVFHFVRVRRSRFVKSVIKPSVSAQSTPHTCVFLSC